jgi:hypothetical protein
MTQLVALSASNTTSRLSPCAFSGSISTSLSALPPTVPSFSVIHCSCLRPSLQSFRDVQVHRVLIPPAQRFSLFGESTTSARQPKLSKASPVFSSNTHTNTHLHSIPSSCLWPSPSFRSSSSSGISTLPDYIATYTNRVSLLLVSSSSLS